MATVSAHPLEDMELELVREIFHGTAIAHRDHLYVGTKLYAINGSSVQEFDTETGFLIMNFNDSALTNPARCLTLVEESSELVVIHGNGQIRVWDANSGVLNRQGTTFSSTNQVEYIPETN